MHTHPAGPISLPALTQPAHGLSPNVHLAVLRRRVPHLFNTPRHRQRSRQKTNAIHFFHMSSSSSSPLNPAAQAGPAPPATPSTRDIIEGWIRELKRDSTGSTLPTPVSAETIISHIRSTRTDSSTGLPVRAALEGNIALLRKLYEAADAYIDPDSIDGMDVVLRFSTKDGVEQLIQRNVIPKVSRFPDVLKDLAKDLWGIVRALVPPDSLSGKADELEGDVDKLFSGILAGIVRYSAANSSLSMYGSLSEEIRNQQDWEAGAAQHAANQSDWSSSDDSNGSSGTGVLHFQQTLLGPPPLQASSVGNSHAPSDAVAKGQTPPPHSPTSDAPSSPHSNPPSEIGSARSSDFNGSRIQAQSSPRRSLAPLNSNQTRARSHSPKLGATNVDDNVLVRKGSRQSSRSRSGSIPVDINGTFMRSSADTYYRLDQGSIMLEVLVSTIQKELAKKDAQMTQRDVVFQLQEELKRVRELAKVQVAHVTASLEKEQRERERERATFQEQTASLERERERERATFQEQTASLERERERERATFQEQTASLERERERERAMFQEQIASLNGRLEEGDRERRELTKELLAVLKPKNVA
ncbi:hypothetical protein L226DRAFT_563229 [Lentinus tigrinus ALCF2SS1-7]|uniref:uncharacterized protein n=1 Tax=Lentinus tigrinus ALCF2SS1-7 TaxID=1328758 RepID=UPI001165DA5A|nr:hypothetical protein L226DRAFT_563229 [Lentinus tigrinus ALCF2SS1-7]